MIPILKGVLKPEKANFINYGISPKNRSFETQKYANIEHKRKSQNVVKMKQKFSVFYYSDKAVAHRRVVLKYVHAEQHTKNLRNNDF